MRPSLSPITDYKNLLPPRKVMELAESGATAIPAGVFVADSEVRCLHPDLSVKGEFYTNSLSSTRSTPSDTNFLCAYDHKHGSLHHRCLVVLEVPLISRADPHPQFNLWYPTEGVDSRGIQQFTRRPIRLGRIETK